MLGTVADAALLCVVSGRDLAAIDECAAAGILVAEEDGFAFRHDLAREAVEQSISAVRRSQLHRRALDALTERTPEDHRSLAHHAAGCGDDAAAAQHAIRAARACRAARRTPRGRGAVPDGASARCGRVRPRRALRRALVRVLSDRPASRSARRHASRRWSCTSWPAMRHSWATMSDGSPGCHGSSAGAPTPNGTRHDPIASLEPLGASPSMAMALQQLRTAADAGERRRRAAAWARRALELATALGDVEIESHALNNLGTVTIRSASAAEGEALLARSLDVALAADLPEHAARAYTNLGSESVDPAPVCRGPRVPRRRNRLLR